MGQVQTKNGRQSRLTFIKQEEWKRSKNGHILWQCLCDCGKICVRRRSEVLSGWVLSCGCLKRDIEKARSASKHPPEYKRAYVAKHKRDRQLFIDGYKAAPCTDCQNTYPPECMQFDHLDASSKIDAVANLKSFSFETIWTEIQKCELVCANCHAIRTRKRLRKTHA